MSEAELRKPKFSLIKSSGGGFVIAVFVAMGLSFIIFWPLAILVLFLAPFAAFQLAKAEVVANCPSCQAHLKFSVKKTNIICENCKTKLIVKAQEMKLVIRDK